jgi:hypothetical protein
VIYILPINRVMVYVALLYAAAFGVATISAGTTAPVDIFLSALGWGAVLNLVILFFGHVGWRAVWIMCPKLNEWVFPDLNGQWRMTIRWFGPSAEGTVNATAIIKQSFFRISMEVTSVGSTSETLAVLPKKDTESGRPAVYYIYRVVPNKTIGHAGDAYEGSAILKVDSDNAECLSGNYHTSRKTVGHFDLRRET